MPRGQPDFGMYAAKEDVASLADMADLAVRLGSIVEYDRRGDVIYLDDFEAPAEKFRSTAISGGYVVLDGEVALSAAQSVKLVTAATKDNYQSIFIHLSPVALGKHGVKISASLYEMQNHDSHFIIWEDVEYGLLGYSAGIKINPYNKTLEYYDRDEGWVVFDDSFTVLGTTKRVFHNMKLVVDFTTGKYVRFMFDVFTWDLSEYNLDFYEPTPDYIYVANFELRTLENEVRTIWLDDFVYTINEP